MMMHTIQAGTHPRAASMMKVPVMARLYRMAEAGRLDVVGDAGHGGEDGVHRDGLERVASALQEHEELMGPRVMELLGIGSGGGYALAAARALMAETDLDPAPIVERAMKIAAGLCVYTNDHILVEELK